MLIFILTHSLYLLHTWTQEHTHTLTHGHTNSRTVVLVGYYLAIVKQKQNAGSVMANFGCVHRVSCAIAAIVYLSIKG